MRIGRLGSRSSAYPDVEAAECNVEFVGESRPRRVGKGTFLVLPTMAMFGVVMCLLPDLLATFVWRYNLA
jgi:hypothetical protein